MKSLTNYASRKKRIRHIHPVQSLSSRSWRAIILASVAVATAWSGYQAAQLDGLQSELYAEANFLNAEANTL
ncbi:MAG: hypothetical protein LUQ22_00365, partial [Methanotrichaceae archaeon]|nr:hypothetical protein [Methanotrichaceae archaeon]